MANPEHEAIFGAGKTAWEEWRGLHPEIRPDLSHIVAPDRDLKDWDLRRVDLSHANLRGGDLSGADLSESNLSCAVMFDAMMKGAHLRRVVAPGVNLLSATLDDGDLMAGDFRGAKMASATFVGARLGGANLQSADCSNTRFERANLAACNLRRTILDGSNMKGADLANADVTAANLSGANLSEANVRGIRFTRKSRFRGIRVEGSFGSRRFRRFAEDQDYLEELRSTRLGKVAYVIWLIVADCGRSFLLWIISSSVFCCLFAALFRCLDVEHQLKLGPQAVAAEGLLGYVEVSVRALLGIDVGQVVSVSRAIRWGLVSESFVGFVLLGGLVSILMNKLARRA